MKTIEKHSIMNTTHLDIVHLQDGDENWPCNSDLCFSHSAQILNSIKDIFCTLLNANPHLSAGILLFHWHIILILPLKPLKWGGVCTYFIKCQIYCVHLHVEVKISIQLPSSAIIAFFSFLTQHPIIKQTPVFQLLFI